MFRLLVERELREILRSPKFVVTFAACSLLILLSFYLGARSYRDGVAQYDAAKAENIRQLEGLTDWLRVEQLRVFLPPQPLAALVNGISNDIGRTTEIQGRGELTPYGSRYGDEPTFAAFRILDLEFIFQIVLTLFAIVFAYDAVNGEKERGTLRLALSNAVPRRTYILGKIAGSYLALTASLLIPTLAGAALLPVMGVNLTGDEWARLGLILLAGFLTIGVFLTLSVLLSSATRRPSHSFGLLLVIWIATVLIVPRVSVLAAGRAVPVPSVDEITSQRSRLDMQLSAEDRNAMGNFTSTLRGDPNSIVGEFQKYMGQIRDEHDRKLRELMTRLEEERANRQTVQSSLALGIARVSPAAAFSLASDALAGTSLSLQRLYLDQAKTYQQEYAKFMTEKTGMNPDGRMIMIRVVTGEEEKPKPIDPAELPEFRFAPPVLAEVVKGAVGDLGLLGVFNLIFFAGAVFAFNRFDVR
jgi:ABC-type transport system involved in multi-copper enzyme maturation permease subunit